MSASRWTLLTIAPPNGSSASSSLRWKCRRPRRSARPEGRRRPGTTVASSASSSLTLTGALAKSPDHPAECLEELGEVLDQVDAGDPPQDREHHRRATAEDPHADAGRLHEDLSARPSMNCSSRFGRVEEVEGVARRRRVEDEQVVAPGGVDLVELLHRHVLLGAGERRGELLVDAVVQDPVAALGIRSVLADDVVEGLLRVEHHRPELAAARARPRPRRRAPGSTRRSALPSSGRPSESASRFAGSIVSTATRLPAGGHPGSDRRRGGRLADAARARADADSALGEQLGQARRSRPAPLLRRLVFRHQAITASASSPISSTPSSGSKRNGSSTTGAFAVRLETLELLALIVGAAGRGQRGETGRARCIVEAAVCDGGGDPLGLDGGEPLGIEAVAVDPIDLDPDLRREVALKRAVSLTGISSGSATIATPVRCRSRMNASSVSACWRIGPTLATLGERARRLQEADPVPGRGRVDDHQVVACDRRGTCGRRARAPRSCRSSPARAARASPRRGR